MCKTFRSHARTCVITAKTGYFSDFCRNERFLFSVKPEVRGILMGAVGRNEQKKRPNPYDQKKT